MLRPTLLLLSLLVCFSSVQAQRTLSLETCIEIARDRSPAARMARMTLSAASLDYEAFKAGFMPQVSLSANLPGLTRSITNILQDDGSISFIPQSLAFSNASLTVNQDIPQTGGSVYAYSSLFNRLDLDDRTNILWQSSPFVVGFSQPLFQFNRMKWNRQEMLADYHIARISYNQAVETAAREVLEIYFDALSAQINVDIATKNLNNNDTILKISRGRFEVGNIAENDLLQSEMSYMNAQTDLETAQLTYEQAIQRLKIALGLPKEENIGLQAPGSAPVVAADPETAVGQALKYSGLLQTANLSRLRASRQVAQAQQGVRPSVNLTASFGLNSSGTTAPEAYKNLVDRETFTIGIEMPIVQWGRGKATLDAARIREEITSISWDQQQASFEVEVRYQVLNLQQLGRQLQRSARGDTIAQRRYDVTKNRYLVGKVDIQALFIAQNEKDGARQRYLMNLRSFWLALARLREMTLYDFEANKPIDWQ